MFSDAAKQELYLAGNWVGPKEGVNRRSRIVCERTLSCDDAFPRLVTTCGNRLLVRYFVSSERGDLEAPHRPADICDAY